MIDPEEIYAAKKESTWPWLLLGTCITYIIVRLAITLIFKI